MAYKRWADSLHAFLADVGVRTRAAEDRSTTRQDPSRRFDRKLVERILEHAPPTVPKAKHLIAVGADCLAHDRANGCVQTGAIATAGEQTDAHDAHPTPPEFHSRTVPQVDVDVREKWNAFSGPTCGTTGAQCRPPGVPAGLRPGWAQGSGAVGAGHAQRGGGCVIAAAQVPARGQEPLVAVPYARARKRYVRGVRAAARTSMRL